MSHEIYPLSMSQEKVPVTGRIQLMIKKYNFCHRMNFLVTGIKRSPRVKGHFSFKKKIILVRENKFHFTGRTKSALCHRKNI